MFAQTPRTNTNNRPRAAIVNRAASESSSLTRSRSHALRVCVYVYVCTYLPNLLRVCSHKGVVCVCMRVHTFARRAMARDRVHESMNGCRVCVCVRVFTTLAVLVSIDEGCARNSVTPSLRMADLVYRRRVIYFPVFLRSCTRRSRLIVRSLTHFYDTHFVFRLCVHFFAEPVGARAPAFTTDAVTFGVRSAVTSTLALTCQAQAFPVPMIR